MNKTISINLGGSIFNIEEDAFNTLHLYLDNIKSNFIADPSCEEIMHDIEERIAELFHQRMSDTKNVVVKSDVDEVIAIMGQPEDYNVGLNENTNRNKSNTHVRNSHRKLYRDDDDKIAGGVCAGLAHYFAIDPIIIRLIVALLIFFTGGSAIIGYVLFWALVPKAATTGEKLRMRGEAVDINNISRMVNEEAKAASQKLNNASSYATKQLRTSAGSTASNLGKALTVMFGLFIMMAGFALLIGILVTFIVSDFNFLDFGDSGFDALDQLVFQHDGTLWILTTGVILTIGAPAIAFIYLGIKLVTGSNKTIKGFGTALIALFILGLIACAYGGIKTGRNFARSADKTETTMAPQNQGDTLHIVVWPDTLFGKTKYHHDDLSEMTRVTDSRIYYGCQVSLYFEPTKDSAYKMKVIKECKGYSGEIARQLCNNISYEHKWSADTLMLASYLSTPRQDPFRMQKVEVVLFVPVGKFVQLGSNVNTISWRSRENELLMMTDDGLFDTHLQEELAEED